MNEREHEALMKKIKEETAKVKKDKAYALKLLISTGMYTPTGRLKKRFR